MRARLTPSAPLLRVLHQQITPNKGVAPHLGEAASRACDVPRTVSTYCAWSRPTIPVVPILFRIYSPTRSLFDIRKSMPPRPVGPAKPGSPIGRTAAEMGPAFSLHLQERARSSAPAGIREASCYFPVLSGERGAAA